MVKSDATAEEDGRDIGRAHDCDIGAKPSWHDVAFAHRRPASCRSAVVELYFDDHVRDGLRTMIIALGLLLIAQAVPPPIAQRNADCAHPVYASYQLVCADPELRAIDARLAEAMTLRVPPAGQWIEDAETWFRRSRRCAMKEDHRDCLVGAYRERLALETVRANAGPSRDCGHLLLISTSDGARALVSAQGQLMLLAQPATTAWTPFISTSMKRGRIIFRNGQGRILAHCQS